jgi:hypothetical protein
MTLPARRKILSKAALYYWIGKGITQIVVADATGTPLLSESELGEMVDLGVTFEQIIYSQDVERVKSKGKGYAEGRLIEYALENSQLLENSSHFYKSTGKTFVRNFEAIKLALQPMTINAIFWRHNDKGDLGRPWADTRFYFTSVDFAVSHIIPSYLESDDNFSACEFHVFNELNQTCQTTKSLRPQVCGFAGGSNEEYFDEPLGYMDFHYPCWIKN